MYASSGHSGVPESSWRIKEGKLRLCTREAETLRWPAVTVTRGEWSSFKREDEPVVNMRGMNPAAARLSVVQSVQRWARINLGVAILVGGPGFRETHQHLRGYRIVTNQPFGWSLPVGCCVDATIVFTVWRLVGDTSGRTALKYMRVRKNRVDYSPLGAIRSMIHWMPVNVKAKELKDEYKQAFSQNPFSWLTENNHGIWVVRLVQSGVVDHYVSINTAEALILG